MSILETVEAFEQAVIDYSWRGAAPPEEVAGIVLHYHQTKAKLYELFGSIHTIPEEDAV